LVYNIKEIQAKEKFGQKRAEIEDVHIIRIIKSQRMRWAERVARMGIGMHKEF
jgi:hypothetical protein